MVWGLLPVEPVPGEDKYYIFKKGTYRVGRKGCDVIVTKDKGVSRVHAEIVIYEMICKNSMRRKYVNKSSKVRIKDCSKYGTFIIKKHGSKEKLQEFPNKEAALEDGDLVQFGTGNATYRFCHVPLVFLVRSSETFQDKISSIGADTADVFSQDCTHIIIDQEVPVEEDLFDAIAAKKPFALHSWLQVVAEKGICTEIPSCSAFSPTLVVEEQCVKVADPKTRERCLAQYTFLLESTGMYKIRERLQSLLEASGAKCVPIEDLFSNTQAQENADDSHIVYVIPRGSVHKLDGVPKVDTLSRVDEINLIRAVVSGNLDPSTLISPSVVISSSCSTDETVVAESEEEVENAATSHPAAAAAAGDEVTQKDEIKAETSYLSKPGPSVFHEATTSDKIQQLDSVDDKSFLKAKTEKVEDSEHEKYDIIYSEVLVVRDLNPPTNSMVTGGEVVNFKRFRKMNTSSGNSFSNLVPFSKYPYKDSDRESEAIAEHMREEKRRKEMESVADQLFNSERVVGKEKGRKHAVSGSLRGLLTRR